SPREVRNEKSSRQGVLQQVPRNHHVPGLNPVNVFIGSPRAAVQHAGGHIAQVPLAIAGLYQSPANRRQPVRGALIEARYSERDLGYMPAGVLNGRPRTADEDIHWVQARYVMIPWDLL